jgi:hypothetical protein
LLLQLFVQQSALTVHVLVLPVGMQQVPTPQAFEQHWAGVLHALPIAPHDDGCVVVVVLDVVVVVGAWHPVKGLQLFEQHWAF